MPRIGVILGAVIGGSIGMGSVIAGIWFDPSFSENLSSNPTGTLTLGFIFLLVSGGIGAFLGGFLGLSLPPRKGSD